MECIGQATQSTDGTVPISSSRWVYFCIGESLVIPLLVLELLLKLRIDTYSFCFVSFFPLTIIPPLETYRISPNVTSFFFSTVMRLVNFFMTLFGPVSFNLSLLKKNQFSNCHHHQALYDLERNLVSEIVLFMFLSSWP